MTGSRREPAAGRGAARRRALALGGLLLAMGLGCEVCPPPPPDPPPPTTGAVLGADDFPGDWEPRSGDTKFGGQSTWNGRALLVNVPDAAAQQVVPAGYQLAANTGAGAGLHPVLFLIGHQMQTKYVLPFATPPVNHDYTEMIVLLPFVQKVGGTLWHNLIVRIYLDDLAPLYLGNLYYGTMKEEATFLETATTFDVERNGTPWFTASFSTAGPWMAGSAAVTGLPNYAALQYILEMPVQGTLTYAPGTPPSCAYFEWSYGAATVRPVSGKLRFLQPPQVGAASWPGLGTLSSVPDGAWELQGIRWRLAFPPVQCVF